MTYEYHTESLYAKPDVKIVFSPMRWLLVFTLIGGVLPAGSAQTSATRTTRKHYAKRKRAAPSYQLHPDPERYQEIQKALADRGYFKGEVNGQWGDDSTDALKRFQADQKLPDDGKINSLSLMGLGLGPKHNGSTPPPNAAPASSDSASSPSSQNPPR